jgi:hypothetical protein
MFSSLETMPGIVALAFTVGAFLLGLLVGNSQGARSTARKIAWKILFCEDLEILARSKLSNEIMEEYKHA